MSNFIGNLVWDYITKPIQERALDNAYQTALDRRNAGIEDKTLTPEKMLDNLGVTDPGLRTKFIDRCLNLPVVRKDPTSGFENFIATAKGEAARLQLQRIANINIDETTPLSKRLFEELGEITKYGITAAGLKVAGSAIPTTNLQYAGIAIDDYLGVSGLSQITGFGYGMLFSNIVAPLVTYELNQKVQPSLPMSGEAIRLGYRQILTDAQVTEILSKQGYSAPYQEALKKGYEFWPSPGDFVRFGVRETYRPEIYTKYQYDAEFPDLILPDAQKGGLSKEWMQHYWRAHWELPSVQLGYEMLHREKITVDELKTLIAISDIAPWWRQKLIDISYSPYTRVDVRRLYKDGVIPRETVLKNYKEIGYDEEHAAKLTEWTCKDITAEKKEKTKDLSESKILLAYKNGKYPATDTETALGALGYDSDEAKLLMSLVDWDIDEEDLDAEWKVLKAEYLAGIKDDVSATRRMGELKMPQRQQEKWSKQLKREARLVEIADYVKKQKAAK